MPEGDTLHRLAGQLAVRLVDRPILAAIARGLVGRRVVAAGAVGKHLLLRVSDDTILRVHLGMGGTWEITPSARAALPHALGLRLHTDDAVHELVAPKAVERFPVRDLPRHPKLAALGPDLCLPQVDLDVVCRRARALGPEVALSQLLLDQRPACGIGNVYKCESLAWQGLHPRRLAGSLDDDALRALYQRAHSLLRSNLRQARRNTSGRPDVPHRVYERAGAACLVCRGRVTAFTDPVDGRWTWWCPQCQGREM